MSNKSSFCVVTAYRWGLRDAHSYVVGIRCNRESAEELARSHVEYRGGKYGCEVCDCDGKQVAYVESPYHGAAGASRPACQPADKDKPCWPFDPTRNADTAAIFQRACFEAKSERDEAREALLRLHDAADAYRADQAYAPHPHIAAVPPVEPADGVALNEALDHAAEVLGIANGGARPMWPEARSAEAVKAGKGERCDTDML